MDLKYDPGNCSTAKMECSWLDKPLFDSTERALGSLLFLIFLWIFVEESKKIIRNFNPLTPS
jgi:hypothetical protein